MNKKLTTILINTEFTPKNKTNHSIFTMHQTLKLIDNKRLTPQGKITNECRSHLLRWRDAYRAKTLMFRCIKSTKVCSRSVHALALANSHLFQCYWFK